MEGNDSPDGHNGHPIRLLDAFFMLAVPLFAYARLRLPHADAPDATQETALVCCGDSELYDPADARARVWAIHRHKVSDMRRRYARRREFGEPPDADELGGDWPIPEDRADSKDLCRSSRAQLGRALRKLPKKTERRAFVRCDLQGRSPEEVAKRMGVGRNTVNVYRTRARRRLRRELGDDFRDLLLGLSGRLLH